MKRYNPKDIEPKWQQQWESDKIYQATEDPAKPKEYVLDFFPYPSGAAMHVGHVRNYTISDAIARTARQQGKNVLHPMGWDAFGLPAENYAIKTGIPPAQTVADSTANFRQQATQMGIGYDWSREINSSDPSYYKWTQWFFTLLFERGLAYQKESLQWWCETDKTVLANEQVEAGRCWRCGNEVTKKPLKQWFFKITDYADRLLEDLDDLDWSDALKTIQRNWIGRSKGTEIDFVIDGEPGKITVFSTRADTLFGATFLVLAPEHPMAETLATEAQKSAVVAYRKQSQAKTEVERQETNRQKTGVFTGAYATNPINNQRIPIWVADYVLYGYGTGAIMAVPAHDDRDREFAQKFDLPIIEVVEPVTGTPQQNPEFRQSIVAIVRDPNTSNILSVDWGQQGGSLYIGGGREADESPEAAARREVAEETGYTNLRLIGQTGVIHHQYFAHSKGVARNIDAHGLLFELVDDTRQATQLEADEQGKFKLTWLTPQEVEGKILDELHRTAYDLLVKNSCYTGEGRMTNSGVYNGMTSSMAREKISEDLIQKAAGTWRKNYKIRDWLISRQRYWGAPIPIIHCPDHGAVAVPNDQLPVELPPITDYQPTGDGRSPLGKVAEWVNTTCPECGKPAKRETDTMDGFACSSWYFLRFADPHNDQKPFDADKVKFWLPVDTYVGGAEHAVMHLLYARFWTKVMYDADLVDFEEPFTALRNHGMIQAPDGRKMSKSLGNVIAPDALIADGYGADSIRLMELFIAPWNQKANWSTEGLGGCYRFLQRFWALAQEVIDGTTQPTGQIDGDQEIRRVVHKTIKKVSQDIADLGFNTAIAAMMEAVNDLYKLRATLPIAQHADTWQWAMQNLAQLLAPFAPHMAEELWHQLGQTDTVHVDHWPTWDEAYLKQDTVSIVVQVNGKVRAQVVMPAAADESVVTQAALANQHVKGFVTGNPKKVIYVPGKLMNIVV